MKKFLPIIVLIALTGMYSCDYISDPYEHTKPDTNGSLCPDKTFPTNTKKHRVVLIEDYTGHKCTACPQAAVTAEKLQDTFKDSLVVVAVHSGYFSDTKDAKYPEEFRTKAGDEYSTKFGFASWPNGLVNRVDYPKNQHIKSFGSWASEVNKLLRTDQEADLQIMSDYNSTDSNACISVQTKFLNVSVAAGTYNMCLLLTQDSIIAPQLDGGVYKPTYVHRHMLKDNINGTWGDQVSTGPVVLEPTVKKYRYKIKHDYSGIVCKPKDCHLVAFLYDVATYRILQAAEIKLIQ